MKKISALLLLAVLSITLLIGCNSPLYNDLEQFVNVDMQPVYDNIEKLEKEMETWEDASDDSVIKKSITDTALPLVEDSLARLEKISPETDEVKELKAEYVKGMNSFKEGFETLAEGCDTQDQTTIDNGYASINEGYDALEKYFDSLDALADKAGATLE